ncbi:MAG TPA: Lrp/AsnC family transcriptional regulator [Methanocorpusculum sp.]|nr:Lrp/AsnC family transcriptional regulator [Methanocorpusculum sp.]
MDQKDIKILHELEQNSRIPTEEIATMLEIDADEVEKRISELLKSGILKKCTAVVDYSVIGEDDVTVLLSLKVTPEKGLGYDGIAEQLSRFPQVKSVNLMTGTYDFQVTINGRTMAEVSRFVAEQIASIDGVKETMTQIIMRTYKEQGVEMSRPHIKDRQLITF